MVAQIGITDDGIAFDTSIYPVQTLEFDDNTNSGNGMESH